ncbi:MAG: hypothetical protein ABUK01_00765 [Leptospirales bacterium]
MKKIIKKLLIKPLRLLISRPSEVKTFKERIANEKVLKLVLGAGNEYQTGWIPTEQRILDVTKEASWKTYLKENSIQVMLAEHVWEHLTETEAEKAAILCYKFLKPEGYIRIAVPDGYHQSQDYIDAVKPGGSGSGSHDHKVLYNYETICSQFENAGFKVELLEYFDKQNNFQSTPWDIEKGLIRRSMRFDERNSDGKPNYTSLIIDAIKF